MHTFNNSFAAERVLIEMDTKDRVELLEIINLTMRHRKRRNNTNLGVGGNSVEEL